jgi:hypothetical protein
MVRKITKRKIIRNKKMTKGRPGEQREPEDQEDHQERNEEDQAELHEDQRGGVHKKLK